MTPFSRRFRMLQAGGVFLLGIFFTLPVPLAHGQIGTNGTRGTVPRRGPGGFAPPTRGSNPAAPRGTNAAPPGQNAPPVQPQSPPGEPLTSDQLQALIIVKGDYSEGTGFVAKMHDHYFIVTNQHVLAGNKQFTLTGADGTKYPTTGAMFGARNYDVAIIQIPDALAKYFLEIDSDPLTNTKTHSPVTVPGNADGTGVPVQIDGQLLGIGPTKIEVSAKFVHGNSGSPIIYRPTGKVIGIATEVIITSMDEVKKAANASPDHWIGFRLDNIPSDTGWVKLDWNLFSAQGLQMQKVEDAGDFLEQFFTSDKLPATDNPQILAAIRELHRNADTNVAQGDAENLVWSVKTFVGQVQKLAEDNMKSLGTQNLYPYFANELQEEQDLWVDLDKAIADGNKQAGDLMTQVLDLK